MTFDTAAIRATVGSLRTADPDLHVFGAMGHRYEFRPPIAGRVLAEFERKHRVRLPADYRTFLSELGNGGAGPFYGIFPLGMFDGSGDREVEWSENDSIVGRLSERFPHDVAWNLPPETLTPPEHFGSDEEEDAWFADRDAVYWAPSHVNGAIPICHHGCAIRTYLVLSGPEAGNVWLDDRASDGGLQPHLGADGNHLTFATWYLRWLDDCRRELEGSK